MWRIVPVLCLLGLLAGCARPRYSLDSCPSPSAPPAEATIQSLRYRVKTDAGKAAAQETSRFMERAAGLWTPLFGIPEPSSLPLEVQVHNDPAAMQQLLAGQHLTSSATGLYLPLSPSVVHVACRGEEPGHPYRTLLHEGTHQFAHLAAGYRAAGKPATVPRLAVPLWLNEGLASYFEAAFISPEVLVPGIPDPDRLSELRAALRRGQAPSLNEILTARYGEEFTSLDYAVAWGIVHVLLQEEPPPWAAGGRDWLTGILAEARRGWPGAGAVGDATGSYDPWWGLVTIAVHDAFLDFVAARGLTLPQWECEWRKWILAKS